jgi:hypothetical protein
VWRVKFTPNALGEWKYRISFKKGDGIVLNDDLSIGEPLNQDGQKGQFNVVQGTFERPDFRAEGRLITAAGDSYQHFEGSGRYFIKGGIGSPENLLAFSDFDNTYGYDSTKQFIKSYDAHVQDWQEGDPTWQDGKGKGLIGAINYLSEKGLNAVYFLSLNIEGDGKDVWMYRDHKDFTRFDCSKLDQWDVVFDHAQKKGVVLHFVTQETENELLLDNGDTGPLRQLYYRELIARFGHHLGVIWNMGEENGPADFTPLGQSDQQRRDMFAYFKKIDPYDNLVALHTHSTPPYKDTILTPLLNDPNLDALSTQIHEPSDVYSEFMKWQKLSAEAGHPWVMYMDEIGPYWQGVKPDHEDSAHDTMRQDVLWASLMAGGAGVEWYFGYKYPCADLDCADWRTRDIMWDQTRHAIEFFENYIPFWKMSPDPSAIDGDALCFSLKDHIYVIYLSQKDRSIQLKSEILAHKKWKLAWYNPIQGGKLIEKEEFFSGSLVPPDPVDQDWVALIEVVE